MELGAAGLAFETLPDELLALVLWHVPHLRAVCRRWRAAAPPPGRLKPVSPFPCAEQGDASLLRWFSERKAGGFTPGELYRILIGGARGGHTAILELACELGAERATVCELRAELKPIIDSFSNST